MYEDHRITFFKENFRKIFKITQNSDISFILEVQDDSKLQELLNSWPDNLKILIVDAYNASINNK